MLDLTYNEVIAECRAAQEHGEELPDNVARTACSYWHDGQGSAFYAFASSGHYDRSALLAELSVAIATAYDTQSVNDNLPLDMLGTYFINREA